MLNRFVNTALGSSLPLIIGAALSGCGNGGTLNDPPARYSVGGNITGLIGSVTLLNNGGNAFRASSNGGFAFTNTLTAGSYNVTVGAQPRGQTCLVTNGSGTVSNANVTNISVSCSTKVNVAYSVGNSLTWDSQPDGVAALAGSRNISLTVGYHIQPGQPLSYTTANPHPSDPVILNLQITKPEYGTFDNALANNAWNIVSIQPYLRSAGTTSTLGTDLAAIDMLINLTKAGPTTNVRYYLYEGWPNTPSLTYPPPSTDAYSTTWDAASVNDLSTPTALSRQYFDNLYAAAKAAHPNEEIFVIPVGSVLSALDKEISAGRIIGLYGIYGLYRDSTHLTLDVGRFVAATTVYATYFGASPVGLDVPDGFYTQNGQANGPPSRLISNAALRNQLEQVVWNVVSSDVRTGLTGQP